MSWTVFDGFARPASPPPSWAGVAEWTAAIDARLEPQRALVRDLRVAADEAFADLGGDPSARDWSSFRPLRRHREEDWSDWLAQLLEESCTGRFGFALLGPLEGPASPRAYVSPTVLREELLPGLRADIIVQWGDGTYTHIEVKVGDPNLSKTWPTSDAVAGRLRDLTCRADVILFLPEQGEAWSAECRQVRDAARIIHARTWLDVALALRTALTHEDSERVVWRAWAHALCGAIEQELLGLTFAATTDEWVRALTPSGLELAERLLTVTWRR